jgi:hypothetical protein
MSCWSKLGWSWSWSRTVGDVDKISEAQRRTVGLNTASGFFLDNTMTSFCRSRSATTMFVSGNRLQWLAISVSIRGGGRDLAHPDTLTFLLTT